MGFGQWYDQKIVPKIVRMGCSDPRIDELRGNVVPLAEGHVFELGVGGGMNQKLYDASRISRFAAIDPSEALLDDARKAAQEKGWQADIRQGKGEAIPFESDSFDTVVCTFTMCSVTDQDQVLTEMRRILKPGGKLLFLEHGRAPDPGPAKWQRRLEPVWKRLMGNCHLSREVTGAVARHGFTLDSTANRYMEKMPRWAGFMEWGVGIKTGE